MKSTFKWIQSGGTRQPPIKKRLLLLISAAGAPPDVRLMDTSEIMIGYWTGDYFRPFVSEYPYGWELKVRYWAMLRDLPEGTVLASRRELGDDVHE
jgi:hypothetical protein